MFRVRCYLEALALTVTLTALGLNRFIRWMLAPNLEWWSQVGQAELDDSIRAWNR